MNFNLDRDEAIGAVLDTIYGMCVFALGVLVIYGILWLI